MNSSVWRVFLPLLRVLLVAAVCLAPFCALGQAVPANWTDDMPSVAKVEAQIQGTDSTDTLERQVAVFEYLQVYIQRIKETRDYKGPYTAGESQLLTDYAKAQNDLQQSYNKTHTQQEIATFGQKEGQYSINNALDWIKQLQGNQSAVAYTNTEADLAASQQRNDARIQQGLNPQSGGGSLLGGGGGASSNSAGSLSADQKRCLELYGDYNTCVGMMSGMVSAIAGLITAALPALAPAGPPPLNGVVLVGLYHSRTDLPEITMSDNGTAVLSKCGTLADNPLNYTIRKSGGATQFVLANEPDPIVLTLQSDGSLAGPGTIPVKGNIITGYNNAYHCVNGNCTTTSTPVYQAKMDSCTVKLLAPQPVPAPAAPAYDSNGLKVAAGPPPIYGFRVSGDYTGTDGMLLTFGNQFVTLDCGQAHVNATYTVNNTASQFTIQVQNSSAPFTLTVSPDNMLRGSGSAAVNGRLVSAVNGQNVSYTPHSETCKLDTFAPKGSQNTMVASNPVPVPIYAPGPAAAAPAPTTPTVTVPTFGASASSPAAGVPISAAPVSALQLAVATSFPVGTNPLAGHVVFLMSDRFDNALRASGGSIAAGTTPGKALQAYAANCVAPKSCPSITPTLNKYYVATAKFDTSGKATLSASLPPGTYYVFTSGNSSGGVLVWDIPAQLSAGPGNTITLASSNAEVVN